ncbi:MAG: hypothetical protein ACRC1M_02600 [Methanobacteriaceae archaeon]
MIKKVSFDDLKKATIECLGNSTNVNITIRDYEDNHTFNDIVYLKVGDEKVNVDKLDVNLDDCIYLDARGYKDEPYEFLVIDIRKLKIDIVEEIVALDDINQEDYQAICNRFINSVLLEIQKAATGIKRVRFMRYSNIKKESSLC